MKLAILLPGYIESPDYHHLVVIDKSLANLGYSTIRIDACNLWSTGDAQNYTTTNYISQVKAVIDSYLPQNPTEIILIGHSLGCIVAVNLGNLYQEVTKIICLSPPISLNRSDHKWVNGFRVSRKDLPSNPQEFREFSIPYSFVGDRLQYSIVAALKNINQPVLIIVGEQDPSLSEVEEVVKELSLPNLIIIKDMGHDFRQSEKFSDLVANEIVKFLEK